LKHNARQGIPPEVDTLKKVRNMCASKALSLADSLEAELGKIGITLSASPNSLYSKMNSDLESARKKLHKFIDDYIDSVRNDLVRKFKGEIGDQGNITKLIQDVKSMVIQLRLKEKQLHGRLASNRQSNSASDQADHPDRSGQLHQGDQK